MATVNRTEYHTEIVVRLRTVVVFDGDHDAPSAIAALHGMNVDTAFDDIRGEGIGVEVLAESAWLL